MTDSSDETPTVDERRSDFSVRAHVQVLLELIREFYAMCHMVAVGQLEPAKAKAKARDVEQRLDAMMADMLAQVEAAEEETGSE